MTESFSSKRKAEEVVSVGQLLDPMNECATRRKVDEASSCVAAAATAVAKAGSAVDCGAEKPSVPKNLMSNREIRRILARKPMVARSEYVALKESNPDLTPSPEEEMDESKKHLYFMARTFYSTEEHHRELQEWVRGELETKGYVELDDDRVRRRAEAKAELEELWKKVEALLLSETEDEDDDDESDSDYDDDDDDDDDELLDKIQVSNHRGDTHVGAALLASASSVSLLRRRPLLVQLRRKEYKSRSNGASGASTRNLGGRCNNNMKYSSSLNDEPMPDAASEKEQGNEYFKQKKFAEAIDCYSRSIGLSPTAVAFANRAMAYLKLRRFKEAEDDCTEALDLDDRYIKAYSRRITARKELGKLKEAMDDAEFAVSIDPNNPELRKQYSEIKALHMEKSAKKTSVPAKRAVSGIGKTADKKDRTSHLPTISQKDSFMEVDSPVRAAVEIIDNADSRSKGGGGKINGNIMQPPRDAKQKAGSEASVQELASRAASLYMSSTVKSVKTPKTAYDFEVSWRALSDDTAQQIQLLKSIPQASLPEIFKNSLSAAFLIDIVKCSASISRDDTAIAVSILENLVKVPRFDLIIMCLSSMHKSELRKIWDQVFLENASADQIEILRKLRGKYIQGGR